MVNVKCWATITNTEERKAVMAWVRNFGFKSFSQHGEKVSVEYEDKTKNHSDTIRRQRMIQFFEQYPEHSVDIIVS